MKSFVFFNFVSLDSGTNNLFENAANIVSSATSGRTAVAIPDSFIAFFDKAMIDLVASDAFKNAVTDRKNNYKGNVIAAEVISRYLLFVSSIERELALKYVGAANNEDFYKKLLHTFNSLSDRKRTNYLSTSELEKEGFYQGTLKEKIKKL